MVKLRKEIAGLSRNIEARAARFSGVIAGRAARISALLLTGVIISRGAEAFTRALVGRHFGSEVLGLYSVTSAVIEISVGFALFGLQNAVLRQYSARRPNGSSVFATSLVVTVGTALLAGVCLEVLSAGGLLRTLAPPAVATIAASTAILCWFRLSASLMQAMKFVLLDVVIEYSLFPVVRAACILVALLAAFSSADATALGTGLAGGIALVASFALPPIGPVIRKLVREPVRAPHVRSLIGFGFPLALAAIGELTMSQFDVLVLQGSVSAAAVGHYAAAVTIGRILFLLYGVAAFVYVPAFAATSPGAPQLPHRERLEDFRLMSAVIAATVSLLAAECVDLVFGVDFRDAALPLAVLTVGYLGSNLLGFNSYHLIMRGRTTEYALSRIGAFLLGIAMYAILIPTNGLVGASLATSLMLIFGAASSALVSERVLGTEPTPISSLIYLLPALAGVAMFGQPVVLRLGLLGAGIVLTGLARLKTKRETGP